MKASKIITKTSYFILAAALYAGEASAQKAAEHANDAAQLGEIVVTAQRRAERLQDVPIAVSALNNEQLTSKGVQGPLALTAVVPSLDISKNGSAGLIYIRGVGSNDGSPNSEASVATYVDGVYIASPLANLFTFNNIERIEVLKGPQGTLFGRNATGGVIQIITRDPSSNLSGQVSAGYGNYKRSTASAYITGGLGEGVAADFSARYDNQGKGYGTNIFTGKRIYIDAKDDIALRSKVLLTPGDRTKIRLSADYAVNHNDGTVFQLAPGSRSVDGNTYPVSGRDVNTDGVSKNTSKQYGGSVQIEHEFGAVTVKSITAYRESKALLLGDYDSTPNFIVSYANYQKVKTVSQELQLLSDPNKKFNWMVGAFYFNFNARYYPQRLVGAAVAPLVNVETFATQKVESGSVFGQASVELAQETNLTVGLRYTTESVKLVDSTLESAGTVLVPFPDQKDSTKKLTWRASLDHKFREDVLVYASYNRGVKTGGYSLLSPSAPGFKPEVLDAFEVGLKSEWLDRKLRANVAAYYYKYKNIQVNQLSTQFGGFTQNAAAATIKGIEAEIKAIPMDNLTISVSAGYLDSEYKRYLNAISYGPSAGPVVLVDASGNKLINAPKFTASGTIDYAIQSSIGTIIPSVTVIHNSGYFVSADNRLAQPKYTLLNASLTWKSSDDRYTAQLWGSNLTNETYFQPRLETAFGDLQRKAAPRTYGVTLGAKF